MRGGKEPVSALLLLAAAAGVLVGLFDQKLGLLEQTRPRSTVLGVSTAGWKAITALALVATAAALGFIAYNQYATNRAVARAYVGLENANMRYVSLIEGGRGFMISLKLKNFGQTPGYRLTSWLKPPVIRPPDAVPFGPPTPIGERGGNSMIGPQGEANMFWTIPVSDAQLAGIKAGTLKIFVWGGVDYEDAFGVDRHFIFRAVNSNAAMINAPGDQMLLEPHAMGYSAN
jgi:hypothetical protein